MAYQPYLIANNSTGFDRERQPWLIPDDAQAELNDGFVYRGVIEKRNGYNYYATGVDAGEPYCESRIVTLVSNEATGQTNTGVPLANIILVNDPIRRGTVTVTDGVESHTDDGLGTFPTAAAGDILYTSGVIVGFQFNAASGNPVTVTYDYHPGNPVMMIANFYTSNDTVELIVADTRVANKYDASVDRLVFLTGRVFTGNKFNFFSWLNYPTIENTQRLLFVNNRDPIQRYHGGTQYFDFQAVISSTDIVGEVYAVGNGGVTYVHVAANSPVEQGSVTVREAVSGQVLTDNGNGAFTGDGTGTINYTTGAMSVTFNAAIGVGNNILVDYTFITSQITTALLMFNFKDRLILLRTTEDGQTFPQRIRISGTGQAGDSFRVTDSGAGLIDIPDGSFIMGASQNRDDLVIFMEESTWIMKYTGNDIVPFTLERIDVSRGSGAPYSPITYLNVSNAYSRQGFIATDGYSVKRTDDKIPSYAVEEIDQENFKLAFSGEIVEDRDHYLIHPGPSKTISDRILVTNYEEQNYQVYYIPLSCMGEFYESFDITWQDLLQYNSWQEFAAAYASWNDIGYAKETPISIGGGHRGEIWALNVDQSEDNPLHIRSITIVQSAPNIINVTTDWNNYAVGDQIYLSSLEDGMEEANNKQGDIIAVAGDNYTFTLQFEADLPAFSAWGSGGSAVRCIPFFMKTKQFNPFIDQGSKVRCGWVYIYASSTGTLLTNVEGNAVPAKLDIDVYMDDNDDPAVYTALVVPYQADISNTAVEVGSKKWYKLFLNQTGKFVQLGVSNSQAGARVKIHAMTFGFLPAGRLI